MFALGIAIPGFIVYSIFFSSPTPEMVPLPGFEGYRQEILDHPRSGYRILEVLDESLVLRINALVDQVPSDRLAARIQATNILYDIQSTVGQDVSISIWTFREAPAARQNMIGLMYFHALTANQVFKTPDEIY